MFQNIAFKIVKNICCNKEYDGRILTIRVPILLSLAVCLAIIRTIKSNWFTIPIPFLNRSFNGNFVQKSIAFTSGRISEDYLQKVIKAGFRIVVSRSAVTAGAVALARRENITMLGFMRKNAGNIYHVGDVTIF